MISTTSISLFRYVPDRYASAFLDGQLRFGSLSYYQNIEDRSRRDVNEGRHVDRPGGGVKIKNLSTGFEVTGDFSFHNRVKHPDRIFCLCFSKSISKDHLVHFEGAQQCIKIDHPNEFLRRMRKALPKYGSTKPIDSRGIIANDVHYYSEREPAPLDIKDPYSLPFMKESKFAIENEYRFVFGRKGAFELVQQITTPQFDIEAEVAELSGEFSQLQIGDIRDIARVIALE